MARSVHSGKTLSELALLRAAVEASGDLVYDWDLATDRINWVGRIETVFGGDDAAAAPRQGDGYKGRINPEDLPERMHALSEHFAGAGAYDCEYRLRAANGEFQWVHDRGTVALSPTGSPLRMSGSLRPVGERKQRESLLEQLANYDELTGHFNKLRLREALDHTLSYSQRHGQPGSFLAVGLDQLDRVNTAFGCEAGDRVLVNVGQRLDHCVRNTDVIGRLGSDRFGVVLGACSQDGAMVIAERIIQTIRQSSCVTAEGPVHVTASVGVVHFPEQSKTSFDAIAKAEGALLNAKSAGRDCVQVYQLSERQRRVFRSSIELGEQVTEALKDDRLVFAYQPVVDAVSHEIHYYECLLRMYDPDGALIPAGAFIPTVERLGLIRALDRRTLEMTLRDLERHPDITLAFNMSGMTVADRGWLRMLVARLKNRADLASRLIVEITETAALHDIDDTARFIANLRDLGCRVAIDDFGAGYTTVRHLKDLRADLVKIDGSFVRNVAACQENRHFVRNLLGLARTFNLITVAECVETAEEAAILTAEGVNHLQGYFFGRPDIAPSWHAGPESGPHATAKPSRPKLDRQAAS